MTTSVVEEIIVVAPPNLSGKGGSSHSRDGPSAIDLTHDGEYGAPRLREARTLAPDWNARLGVPRVPCDLLWAQFRN